MVNTTKNFLIMLNNLQQMHLKLLQETAEATGDLIGNKIANGITKVSKNSQQNNSELQLQMGLIEKDRNY